MNLSNHRWLTPILLLALIAISSPAHARKKTTAPQLPDGKTFCGTDDHGKKADVCVLQQMKNGGREVAFSVWNGYPFPVTLTLDPKLSGLKTDAVFPMTRVLPPGVTDLYRATCSIDSCTWSNEWNFFLGPIAPTPDPDVRYDTPFPRDRTFRITQGYNGGTTHTGENAHAIDWDMPEGTAILAAREGYVIAVEDSFKGHGLTPEFRKKTNQVTILHDDGTLADYGHIRQNSARVFLGDRVRRGDVLALSGDVGYSDFPHLHFRVYRILGFERYESLPVLFRDASIDPWVEKVFLAAPKKPD